MDSVLTEFISKTSAEPARARDILESKFFLSKSNKPVPDLATNPTSKPANKWILKDALKDFHCTNEIVKAKSTEIKPETLVKSNSHPLLCGTSSSKTVIGNEPNVSIKLNNKSIDKLSENLIADQPVFQKKLFRGISRATDNLEIVSKVRGEFAQDFQSIKDNDSFTENMTLDLPYHTFTMPDLSIHPEDFRQFLEKDLIEKSTLISLKSAKRLNWWADQNIAQELWPLATTGDGNCLLHAASLSTWGFHDRLLTLRKGSYHDDLRQIIKDHNR